MDKLKRTCHKAISEFYCGNTPEQLKIRPELIPNDVMDCLTRALYNSIKKALEDPVNRADFEAYCAEHPDE